MTDRPSIAIYRRTDDRQEWRRCETPYDLGYAMGWADAYAALPTIADDPTFGWMATGDMGEGYTDGYGDHAAELRFIRGTV